MARPARGTFFLVVGPSGVGKDTMLDGAFARIAATGRYLRARRAITRPAGPGEDHLSMTEPEFAAREAAGGFLLTWQAHGLRYGLPSELAPEMARGVNVIANGSRTAVAELMAKVSPLVVVEVTAPPELRRARILARGREDATQVDARIARVVEDLPEGVDRITIANDSTVEEGVEHFVQALEAAAGRPSLRPWPVLAGRANLAFLPPDPEGLASSYLEGGRVEIAGSGRAIRASVLLATEGLAPGEIGLSAEAFERLGLPAGARVSLVRTPPADSRALLRRKIEGGPLTEAEYARLFTDMVEGRYAETEMAGFLLRAIQTLDDDEVIAVAGARRSFMPRIDWGAPMVVDKHSLGGIPGSRITLIVVPIVAAHGLLMPKTSSRAITSAAGTADTMEAACRVDLDKAELTRAVRTVGGSIAWNGRLNHSPLDDVVNAITRPLGLDSNRWSVASILSKKWSAGSTHVVVDLPYGPRAKLPDLTTARELGRLFEHVGRGLGLVVSAIPSDGSRPIGRGIGPALELRDVRLVLGGDAAAPVDLREKALRFAAEILSFDPAIGSRVAGRARAEELLTTGAALRRFEAIIDAQGRHPEIKPASLCETIRHDGPPGVVGEIDGWRLAGIARAAGAPSDKAAGVDLHLTVGDVIGPGSALYTIHATAQPDLVAATAVARAAPAIIPADGRVSA